MTKEEKISVVTYLKNQLEKSEHFYITDVSNLTVADSNKLRRLCFEKNIKFKVVKNILLKKAMESTGNNYGQLVDVLKGSSSIMFSGKANIPAQVIKQFRKENEKPTLKGAYINGDVYLGDNQLDVLKGLKSKEEVIGEIIMLLQSPAKNVISALLSGKNKIAGIVKTLSEKPEDSKETKTE